jgi:hypothetical protein
MVLENLKEMDQIDDSAVDAACQAILREYMKRKGYMKTWETFETEQVGITFVGYSSPFGFEPPTRSAPGPSWPK